MGDIRCAVCGEPWDQWGANHGDMKWWQYDLFKAGAGCPACKGDAGQHENMDSLEEHLRDVVMNSEDPDSFLRLHDQDNKPEWKEPTPKKLWECAGCHVQVVIDNEAPYDGAEISKDDIWLVWHGGDKVHYSGGSGPWAYSWVQVGGFDRPTKEPENTIDGKPYCPGCTDTCSECGTVVFSREDLYNGDPQAKGASFPNPDRPMHGVVCLDCLTKLEETDVRGGHDCLEHQPMEDGTCGVCHERVTPPVFAPAGTGQVCGAANDCARWKGHSGPHKNRQGKEW